MSRYVFDIETDGLLLSLTRMWVMVLHDLDTGAKYVYEPDDNSWMERLNKAKTLAGHFIKSFDLPALKKLYKWEPPIDCKIIDTVIFSQVLNYKRFGSDGHSLARWGQFLGDYKVEHEDWTQYSPEMRHRCERDVEINVRVYNIVMEEFRELVKKTPSIRTYIQAEHAAAEWSAEATLHGWPFNLSEAEKLFDRLSEETAMVTEKLEKLLGTKVRAIDKKVGIVHTKKPKWIQNGCYDAHTANWFNIDPWSGFEGEERLVEGEYCRIEIVPLKLSSSDDVKIFLFRNGWEPTEWNFVKEDDGTKRKTSPKITEDSLELLGGDGALYMDYTTAKSRLGILKTWIENTDENGMLHGECQVIGTPSMRARHSIIVNVPSGDSTWGPEMRALFGCLPGWTFIGADSAGNQARGLAHYLGDPIFIDTLLNGDIHTYNAEAIDSVLKSMGIDWAEVLIDQGVKADNDHTLEQNIKARKRSIAKRILYAFLFGASGGKLWSYIFGRIEQKNGNKFKAGFLKAVPGFKELIEKLEKIFASTSKHGDGYIPSLAGNRIYVDSFHKLLVYLLQAAEKITCSTALMITAQQLKEKGIPYIPLIFYHDEIDFMVPTEFAEIAAPIAKDSFKEGPKAYGIEIMDGGVKLGSNWFECH